MTGFFYDGCEEFMDYLDDEDLVENVNSQPFTSEQIQEIKRKLEEDRKMSRLNN